MEEIIQLFIRSFEDASFSSSERKAVRQLIEGYHPDRPQRDLLRSRIFDIARTRFPSHTDLAVFNWLEIANKTLLDKSSDFSHAPSKVYFSPGEDCLDAILHLLNTALRSLCLCVFTISDDRITRAIIQAHQRKVKIRLLTDNEKLYDDGSDIRQLSQTGIPVRVDQTSNHMHHKFAIADDGRVLTGSYNWTRSATLYNHENIVLIEEPKVVQAYTQEFARLWEEMVPFR
jgi:phosphatidylserine/phosphatidylglycerophosphate/cardiolipin synthase-like enzyme